MTWHHGLMARWWAEFGEPEVAELSFYRGAIERFGEPALDLACGAGRLLLPLVEAGLDVDGVDLSTDMLAQARLLADARDVSRQVNGNYAMRTGDANAADGAPL